MVAAGRYVANGDIALEAHALTSILDESHKRGAAYTEEAARIGGIDLTSGRVRIMMSTTRDEPTL